MRTDGENRPSNIGNEGQCEQSQIQTSNHAITTWRPQCSILSSSMILLCNLRVLNDWLRFWVAECSLHSDFVGFVTITAFPENLLDSEARYHGSVDC